MIAKEELRDKLRAIRERMTMFTTCMFPDNEAGDVTLNKEQAAIVKDIFDVFDSLSWELSFDLHKQMEIEKGDTLRTSECGTPVKVAPCDEKYGGKTYFGILIGDIALSLSGSIKEDTLTISKSFYNPAIFVPELKTVIYGCESWWGRIESEDDLKKLITNETIENVWYMKLLKTFTK